MHKIDGLDLEIELKGTQSGIFLDEYTHVSFVMLFVKKFFMVVVDFKGT